MPTDNQISVPTLVRAKTGALDRVGIYLSRSKFRPVAVLQSQGLVPALTRRLRASLKDNDIEVASWVDIDAIDIESAVSIYTELPGQVSAIVGIGGGKAMDVAKYVATLARLPYFAVPTSLSNDGFCSPQSSLRVNAKRRSLPASIPYGVIIDTEVCQQAPLGLTLSGVGDLAAKFTAIVDWKLAFHHHGEPVNDFAVLLSDGSVNAFLSHPRFDLYGIRLLATALMMNGVAMVMSGSSRPASGSEHLISHAIDRISTKPRLHGLQVGVATYLISLLQGENTERIDGLFQATGFWDYISRDPFPRGEWVEAVALAPQIKQSFYTILSSRDALPEVERLLDSDPRLKTAIV